MQAPPTFPTRMSLCFFRLSSSPISLYWAPLLDMNIHLNTSFTHSLATPLHCSLACYFRFIRLFSYWALTHLLLGDFMCKAQIHTHTHKLKPPLLALEHTVCWEVKQTSKQSQYSHKIASMEDLGTSGWARKPSLNGESGKALQLKSHLNWVKKKKKKKKKSAKGRWSVSKQKKQCVWKQVGREVQVQVRGGGG